MKTTEATIQDIKEDKEEPERKVDVQLSLAEILEYENIADALSKEELADVSNRVMVDYENDMAEAQSRLSNIKKAVDMAMLITTPKNYPWPKASNIKLPILSEASIGFAQQAYPAMIQSGNVVKGVPIGEDDGVFEVDENNKVTREVVPVGAKQERADRVSEFMNWQLMKESDEWEEQTDKLLQALPVVGCMFRKIYHNPMTGKTETTLRYPEQCIVAANATSIRNASRITDKIEYLAHEIEERIRAGVFLDFEYGVSSDDDTGDEYGKHNFYEQHRLLDLDGDGYPEPYIVTLHVTTRDVVRIVPRFYPEDVEYVRGEKEPRIAKIKPIHCFIKYAFMPSFDGSIYDMGLGELLLALNESANTSINQMLDAGHKSIAGGGLIGKGARIKGGSIKAQMGKWTVVDARGDDLRKNMIPVDAPPPSPALFQLLGFITQQARDLSGTAKVLTGDSGATPDAALTAMEMVEEGARSFKAIYRRLHRALTEELDKHYELNSRYLDEDQYLEIMDAPKATREDFNANDNAIAPVSDPNVANESQRMARARYLLSFKDDPRIDGTKIIVEALRAGHVDDPESYLAPPPEGASQEQIMLAQELENRTKEADARMLDAQTKARLADADIALKESTVDKNYATSVKELAQAESLEDGVQLGKYKDEMDRIKEKSKP